MEGDSYWLLAVASRYVVRVTLHFSTTGISLVTTMHAVAYRNVNAPGNCSSGRGDGEQHPLNEIKFFCSFMSFDLYLHILDSTGFSIKK